MSPTRRCTHWTHVLRRPAARRDGDARKILDEARKVTGLDPGRATGTVRARGHAGALRRLNAATGAKRRSSSRRRRATLKPKR